MRERTGGVAGRDASVGMAGVGEAGRGRERREPLGRDEKGQTLRRIGGVDVDGARFETKHAFGVVGVGVCLASDEMRWLHEPNKSINQQLSLQPLAAEMYGVIVLLSAGYYILGELEIRRLGELS